MSETSIQPAETAERDRAVDRLEVPSGPRCEVTPGDVVATASRTGALRLVRVRIVATCPSPGWRLQLRLANSGIVPDPSTLCLELVALPPTVRSSRAIMRTETEAIVEDATATQVNVRFGWRDPITVPVVESPPRRRGRVRAPRPAPLW